MIPKVIHYIWLGGTKKPNLVNICIKSWKEKLPDYEIIEWNEKNLDIDKIARENKFFAECRKRKLWAYMADYLRLKILYENGGIYFDTDVEVEKNLDDLLNQPYIIGFENKNEVSSAVIGCEKENELIKKIWDFYQERIWNEHIYVITHIMTKVIKEIEKQSKQNIKIYSKDYFSPIEYQECYSDSCLTENTYTIHWFNASWNDKKEIHTFLEIKHIRNPIKKKILIIKKTLGYYYRKLKKRVI